MSNYGPQRISEFAEEIGRSVSETIGLLRRSGARLVVPKATMRSMMKRRHVKERLTIDYLVAWKDRQNAIAQMQFEGRQEF